MMQMRTHTCGELRLADAGKSVKIVGWMENVREVGSNSGLRRAAGLLRHHPGGGGDRGDGGHLQGP